MTCLRHDGDEHVVESDDDLEAGVAGGERGKHVHHSQRPPLRPAERPIAIRRQRRPRRRHLCTARSRVDDRVDDNRNELSTVIGYARATATGPRSSAHGRTRPALRHHASLREEGERRPKNISRESGSHVGTRAHTSLSRVEVETKGDLPTAVFTKGDFTLLSP